MRRNFWIGFILILGLIGLGAYVSLPSTEQFLGRDTIVRQGLDLQGGARLVYELDLSRTNDDDRTSAIESTRQVIERRVNSTGVTEPLIQPGKLGTKQTLIVELPGITDVNEATDLIGKTAQLDFREADPNSDDKWLPTGLTGKQLSKATIGYDQITNKPQINLTFNSEGKQLFADITGRNIGKPVAIFLDEELLQAPTVQDKITAGEAIVTSTDWTIQEVKKHVSLLNAGALDVPIKLVEQRTVGATLGEDSVKRSLVAGLVGLILVVIFMLINYRVAGIVAVLALLAYTVITFGLFKYIPVTLTLAGIAGFILSIGMAVDANILMFERMREELALGKDIKIAMEESFRRAWPSVRDSNMATLITCAILFFFTTGVVKGFALTLAVGVIVSLFSSITVSRSLLRLFALNGGLRRMLERV